MSKECTAKDMRIVIDLLLDAYTNRGDFDADDLIPMLCPAVAIRKGCVKEENND